MSYRIDSVNADRATIDAYLGPNEFQYWTDQMNSARRELARYDKLRQQIPVHWIPYMAGESDFDATYLEAAAFQYSDAVSLIQAGKKVSRDQLDPIVQIQSGYLEALRDANDNLEAIFNLGLFTWWMSFQFQNIEFAAAQAQPRIDALRRALEVAKTKRHEAEAQGVIDTGLFVLGFFVPEIAVLTKVTIAVGQWAMDDYLGGSKSSDTVDNLSNVNSGGGVGHAAIDDWKFLSPKAGKAVKVGAKAIAVAGLYFDVNEIQTAMEKAGVAERTLNEAVVALTKVKALVDKWRPAMLTLKMTLIRVAKVLKDSQDTIDNVHRDVRQIRDSINWSTAKVNWKFEAYGEGGESRESGVGSEANLADRAEAGWMGECLTKSSSFYGSGRDAVRGLAAGCRRSSAESSSVPRWARMFLSRAIFCSASISPAGSLPGAAPHAIAAPVAATSSKTAGCARSPEEDGLIQRIARSSRSVHSGTRSSPILAPPATTGSPQRVPIPPTGLLSTPNRRG